MLLLEWVLLGELLLLVLAAILFLIARKPDEEQEGERAYRVLRAFWKTILEKTSAFEPLPAFADLPSPEKPAPKLKAKQERTVILPVLVVPESTSDQVVGLDGDTVKMLVSTAAGSGQTNKAVLQLLIEVLQIQPHQVQIIRGHYNARKHVQITGIDKAAVIKKLNGFL